MSTNALLNESVLVSYFETINAENWSRLPSIFCFDAEMHAVGTGPLLGLDAISGFFESLFDSWRSHDDTPTRLLPSGDTITAEVLFTGTTLDGRLLQFEAVDVVDFRNGKIARLTNWYDLLAVRKMLRGHESRQ